MLLFHRQSSPFVQSLQVLDLTISDVLVVEFFGTRPSKAVK
jgi:hypothetical protein